MSPKKKNKNVKTDFSNYRGEKNSVKAYKLKDKSIKNRTNYKTWKVSQNINTLQITNTSGGWAVPSSDKFNYVWFDQDFDQQ